MFYLSDWWLSLVGRVERKRMSSKNSSVEILIITDTPVLEVEEEKAS